LKNEKTVF